MTLQVNVSKLKSMQKILVVEDEIFLSNVYKAKLEQAGYEVKIALDGEEAMKALEIFIPDAIILDLILPKIDGFETLKTIRKNKKWKEIPVLVVTNLGQKQDIDSATDLGITDYMIKTEITPNDVITKINQMLQKPPQQA